MHNNFVDATSVVCGEDRNLCLGQNLTVQCDTAHPFLEWSVPEYRIELDFSGIDTIGSIESSGDFIAALIRNSEGNLSSELRFQAKNAYNNTDIICMDGFTGEKENCTPLLTGEID